MRTRGLVAASFTPMRPNGDIDLEAVLPLVDHLVGEGVSGIFCNGSTAEAESLTPEERRAMAGAMVAATGKRVPVFVQVGSNSVRVAQQLAGHATEVGADAIAATPPAYFKPARMDDLIDCLREIAVGAPKTPLYYYHIPRLTGVELDMVELLRRAGDAVPTLAGIKFSDVDLPMYSACVAFDNGRFDVLWGSDETLMSGVCAGARAAIGSTYCFAAPVYREVIAACEAGDLAAAREWQARSVRMVDAQLRRGGLPALKATMRLIGIDCGPVRLPWRSLSDDQIDDLRDELERVGYFDWGRP